MKIIITQNELREIMSARLGGVSIDSVEVQDANDMGLEIVNRLTTAAKPVSLAVALVQDKIKSIKALREIVREMTTYTMGLAEAKWAVENWNKWIGFVSEKGKIPNFNGTTIS